MFLRYLPGCCGGCHFLVVLSCIPVVQVEVCPLIAVRRFIDFIQEGETSIFAFVDGSISYLTPRITHFEHIHPRQMFLHKLLFGNIPCQRHCRKEPETVVGGKIFGTGVTTVEVDKIAVFPVVSNSTGISLVTIGNTGLQVVGHAECL